MAGTLSVRTFDAPVIVRRTLAASIGFCLVVFASPASRAGELPVAAATLDRGAMGQRILALVNRARAESRRCGKVLFRRAGPVYWNEALTQAALNHSEDMAHHDYVNHHALDGSTPSQRIKRAGYAPLVTGENIAAGQMTPEEAMSDWIRSPAHCAILMDPEFTEMGVALATRARSRHGAYWTQLFGTPRARRKDRG